MTIFTFFQIQKHLTSLFFVIISISSVLFLFPSCQEESLSPSPTNQRTLIVYLAGNNSLSDEVNTKRQALLQGWNKHLGNLLVISSQTNDAPILQQAQQNNQGKYYKTLKKYTQTNMADTSFLNQVWKDIQPFKTTLPMGLILFSHGTGWYPAHQSLPFSSYAPSLPPALVAQTNKNNRHLHSFFEDAGKSMNLHDFATSLPANLFEFIVFDMCFMNCVEVAFALKEKVPYCVGSVAEILSPGFTPIYATNLFQLYSSTPNLIGFAKAFFNYHNAQKGLYQSATISVVHTPLLQDLADFVRSHHSSLLSSDFQNVQYFDPKTNPHIFFDLGDYLKTKLNANEVDRLLNRCVVFKAHTPSMLGLPINTHSGLSIYIPSPSLPTINSLYQQSLWAIYTQSSNAPLYENKVVFSHTSHTTTPSL